MNKVITIFLVLYCLHIPEIHGAAVAREDRVQTEGSFNVGVQAGFNGFVDTLNTMFGGISNSGGLLGQINNFIVKINNGFRKIEDTVEEFFLDLLSLLPGIDIEVIKGNKNSSGSANGTEAVGFKGVLKTTLQLPFKIPKTILEFGFNTIWDVLSLQFNIAKIPIDAVFKVLSIIQLVILVIFTSIFEILMKIEGVNSEILNSVIVMLKDFVKFVISNVASVQIFGIQTGFDALGFVRGRIDFIVQTVLNVIFFVLNTAWNFIMNIKSTFKLDAVLRLPVISNFVELGESIYKASYQLIHGQLEGIIQFAFTIIEDHQDFFIPLFAKITNFFTAIINAARQIYSGDFNGGFEAMLGPFKIAFNSFNATGDWNMTLLDGVSMYGNLAIDSFCQSVGRKPKQPCPP